MLREARLRHITHRLADDLWHYRREIVGLLVAFWGLAALAAMLELTRGTLICRFSDLLFAACGAGAPALALSLVLAGSVLAARVSYVPWRALAPRLGGLALFWLASLLLVEAAHPAASAASSYGGGLGWTVAEWLRRLGGTAALWLAGLLSAAEGLLLALGVSWREIGSLAWRGGGYLRQTLAIGAHWLMRQAQTLAERLRPAMGEGAPAAVDSVDVADGVDGEAAEAQVPAPAAAQHPADSAGCLPPIAIFDVELTPESANLVEERARAKTIEETLAGFGIPAEVVEVLRGPAVTQFGVRPGYLDKGSGDSAIKRKVRVAKIKALADDLSLSLAASPIRIETPIPGRPLVGIQVPNSDIAVVGIRAILESPEYQQAKGQLRIALGRDISGKPVVVPLERMPHLLLAGATGSGKSVCIGTILASLLYANSPDELRLMLIDPKRVELARYEGIPHLLGKPEVEVEGAIAALRWACQQMDERYREFASVGARDIRGYNARAEGKEDGKRLPRIVIVIDELADLMLTAPEEVERAICRLAQMARATGIHLVVATQRPSVNVVTGLIKANFPARISFAVMSQTDSRVILDSAGAEDLIGRGDMLYHSPDTARPARLQGAMVSEEETRRLLDFWRRQVGEGQLLPICPWSAALEGEEEDQMLAQAIEVARQVSALSASYLQRRLRIGYPRAAHLLDQLADAGIVGPPQGSGRTRQVLIAKSESAEQEAADVAEEAE